MNEHDSERIKGMLESLGYAEAPSRSDADLILFNTCSIREAADSRFVAHLGEAKRIKREQPDTVIGVGGCWAQSVKEEVFARFPFVDVAFGPGQVHKLAEFRTSDSLTAQGFFEFEGFTGHLPAKRSTSAISRSGSRLTSRPRVEGTMQYEQTQLQPTLICSQPWNSRSRRVGRWPAKSSNSKYPCAVSESEFRNSASL